MSKLIVLACAAFVALLAPARAQTIAEQALLLTQEAGIINCSLAYSAAAGGLTFTLNDGAGYPLNAADPCVVITRNPVAKTSGVPAVLTIMKSLTLTFANGSSLGASGGGIPFRIWLSVASTDGTAATAQLVASIRSNPALPQGPGKGAPAIAGISEHTPFSTVGCNACSTATALQTAYSTTSMSGAMGRILGWANWGDGLPTAGAWTSGPTTLALRPPGTALPGQPTGNVAYSTDTATTAASDRTPVQATPTITIDLFSNTNFVEVTCDGTIQLTADASGKAVRAQIGAIGTIGTPDHFIGNVCEARLTATSGTQGVPCHLQALDAPLSALSQTYAPYIWGSAAAPHAFKWNTPNNEAICRAVELHG